MLILFFICIGTTNASNASDNVNNTKEINSINDIVNDTNFETIGLNSKVENGIFNSCSSEKSSETNNITKNSDNTDTLNSVKNESVDNNSEKNTNSNKTLAAGGDVKPSKLSQSSIFKASTSLKKYIHTYKKLPNYVTIDGYKFSMPEFMYLMSKTIVYKCLKNNNPINVKYNIKNPSRPSGYNIYGSLTYKQYYSYSKSIVKFMDKYNQAPNYVYTKLGKVQYQKMIFGLSSILYHVDVKKVIPKSLRLAVQNAHPMNKYIPNYNSQATTNDNTKAKTIDNGEYEVPNSPLNSKYNGESLTQYLKDSKNCQVSDKTIKSLAASITKNCKNELQKATDIFNWVRDKISYSFYYNTKHGAKNTLAKRAGNCVDKTHLLIALMRSSGIAAKYVNGQARFTSGNTYGHVWAQVKIGNTWVVADTTSSRNSFGFVNNWYPSTAKVYGRYSSISF